MTGLVLLAAIGFAMIMVFAPHWLTNHWWHWLKWWDDRA